MDGRSESSQAIRDTLHQSHIGDRSPTVDDGSDQGQSSKKRKLSSEDATSAAETSSRFLFVDSSSSSQRPRSDQRAINAHIQQTAHRNRKQAAQRQQQTTGAANIGRNRRAPPLQPRPIEPQRVPTSPSTFARRGPIDSDSPRSFEGSPEPSSRVIVPPERHSPRQSSTENVRSESHASESRSPARPRSPPGFEQRQIDRLRHYSNIRGPEVEGALLATRTERYGSEEAAQTDRGDATSSVRSMLSQILQRLDAGHGGHSIPGTGALNVALKNTILDPFNISSVHITPAMNSALRHFSDNMIPAIFPTRHQADIQTQWAFQNAAQEPLVLYSLLAVASAERSARLGELRSGSIETTYTEADLENRAVPEFVSYKVKAVKIANETMKSMETAAKASTIFAMMCLLSIEAITGNQKEIFAHVSGLQRLIAWRGGYHEIPPHATELILSTSYMSAAMTRSLPAAPPTSTLHALPPELVQEIRQNIPDELKKMGSGILNDDVDQMLDWSISQAFRDMRDVVQYREYYHEKQVLPVEDENDYINAKSYQFRYTALSAPFNPQFPTSEKEDGCRLALLIFWFSNYQVTAPDSALNRTLTAQLKTALQGSDLKGLWGRHTEMLAWVLMLGAFVSAGQRERPWFVMNLAKVARSLQLQQWDDVRSLLLKFFYLERIYAAGMSAIWDEVLLLAESLD